MEVGVIIFIIGIIYSIFNSIAEQNKKNREKNLKQSNIPKQQHKKTTFKETQGKIKQTIEDAKREYERARQEIYQQLANPDTQNKQVQKAEKKVRDSHGEIERKGREQVNRAKERVSNRVPRETIKKSERVQSILTDTHLSEKQKKQRLDIIQEGDLTEQNEVINWDKKAVVNGIIMSEILTKPKSRR